MLGLGYSNDLLLEEYSRRLILRYYHTVINAFEFVAIKTWRDGTIFRYRIAVLAVMSVFEVSSLCHTPPLRSLAHIYFASFIFKTEISSFLTQLKRA